jgi:undecaprenyl-diphosphatase
MIREEFLQDLKALAGVPLFCVVVALAFVLGKVSLASQVIVGLVLAYVLTVFIRTFYFRLRPDREKYHNYFEKINASSFPSMHAMRASVLATLLILYFNSTLLTVLFIVCALGVAVSRVMTKRHYTTDVTVGLILGVLLAFLSVWLVARFIS